ncbi:MAG: hypothetical protein U0990_08050 [Candidatus Nanopelagicales bacterium]|nr:hypothetical protein [Candidatus Nanopelagicales bacterium]MDZ4250027.1 hypothetical protein [Candidatus Nanopelagicales bacterium]
MRALKLAIAVVLIVCGTALVTLGGVGVYTFGTSGTVTLATQEISSGPDAHALVANVVAVTTGLPGGDLLGKATIGARSQSGERLFLGLAQTSTVDQYLRGARYDVVGQENGQWKTLPVPGTSTPAPPRDETFWTRQAVGSDPSFEYVPPTGGSAAVVVMNPDGRTGVSASFVVGYTSSTVFPLSVAAIVLGAAAAASGATVAYRSRRRRANDGWPDLPPPPTDGPGQ